MTTTSSEFLAEKIQKQTFIIVPIIINSPCAHSSIIFPRKWHCYMLWPASMFSMGSLKCEKGMQLACRFHCYFWVVGWGVWRVIFPLGSFKPNCSMFTPFCLECTFNLDNTEVCLGCDSFVEMFYLILQYNQQLLAW